MKTTHVSAALLASLGCVSSGVATAEEGEWHHTAFVYGMGAALEGDAYVGPLHVPVHMSMSDVFDALEFGAMGAYRATVGMLIVAVGSFILRSLIRIFFGPDFSQCDFGS